MSLPNVDPERIGFYGLSYGGKSAMRLPAILPYACSICSADFDDWVALNTTTVFLGRYALSICSADFNEWIAKTTSTTFAGSYLFTGEYEMPEWNLGNNVRQRCLHGGVLKQSVRISMRFLTCMVPSAVQLRRDGHVHRPPPLHGRARPRRRRRSRPIGGLSHGRCRQPAAPPPFTPLSFG